MKKTNLVLAMVSVLLAGACKKDEPAEERYQLLPESSRAVWKGYLRNGYFNEGSIRVESQDLRSSGGQIGGGTFQMPLSGLENFNLPTADLKAELIHHLQSADFFNMALHPAITFEIGSVAGYGGGIPDAVSGANKTVSGKLSLLGKPLDISFPARVSTSGDTLYVAAVVKVDRTRWGMSYASDPSLPDDKQILPVMEIRLDLKGVRK